jgi:penicillin-binding protein-related factor A (putative recombinase)
LFFPKNVTKKQYSGYTAQKKGKNAEDLVLSAYRHNPDVFVFKRYEPYKRVGKPVNGVFKGVNEGKSGCDFAIFTPKGAGLFECKSRKGTRIQKDAIDVKQAQELDLMHRLGHFSFVLVQLRTPDIMWFRVEWEAWKGGLKKSHNMEDLLEIGFLCPVNLRKEPLFCPL